MSLNLYLKKFSNLRVDRTHGTAPHKPILLLAVSDNIEKGLITDNHICITPDLVATFMEIWSMLVNSNHQPTFALPFYHLKSSGFWKIVPYPGMAPAITSSNSIKSFKALKEAIAWAEIDTELFDYLRKDDSRQILRSTILNTYFPITQSNYLKLRYKEGDLLKSLENKILNEPPIEYKAEIETATEEEIFLRGGAFKRIVPKVYNYSCCISGMRIIYSGISLTDACHIIPFAESHDDTITNGISLCPNLHRAFDRHLISIDEDYRVILKKDFAENKDSDYSIKKYEGKQILIPIQREYWPAQENLEWHRKY
jgi:putative restriction endonuclease